MAVVMATFASCNKDQKINKQLDGEWNMSMYDGKAITAGDVVLKFVAGKDGAGTVTTTIKGQTPAAGTYVIKDAKFTSTTGSKSETSTINEHTSTKFKITNDTDHKVIEMTKK